MSLRAFIAAALAVALSGCLFGGGGDAPGVTGGPPFCEGNLLVRPATAERIPCAGVCRVFDTGEAGCYAAPLTACARVGAPVCSGSLLTECAAPGYVAEGGADCARDGRACTEAGVGGCVFADVDCPTTPETGTPIAFCAPDGRSFYATCLGGHPAARYGCAAGAECHDYVDGPTGDPVASAECVLPIACDGPAGARACTEDDAAILTCGGHGAVTESEACGAGAVCRAENGAVECVDDDLTWCDEGEARCTWDDDGVQRCGATRYLLPAEDCYDVDWDAVCVEELLEDGKLAAGCHEPPDCDDDLPAACDEERDWLLVCDDGEFVRAEECDWGCDEATADTPAQCD